MPDTAKLPRKKRRADARPPRHLDPCDDSPWMSLRQVSDILGITPRLVKGLPLPIYPIGPKKLYDRDEVNAYVRSQRIVPSPASPIPPATKAGPGRPPKPPIPDSQAKKVAGGRR